MTDNSIIVLTTAGLTQEAHARLADLAASRKRSLRETASDILEEAVEPGMDDALHQARILVGARSARFGGKMLIDALVDKISGLDEDLTSAVEKAYRHGARDWVRLNYPEIFRRMNAADKKDAKP